MKKAFIVVHANDSVGAWEMPEHMLDIFNRFMEALASGNESKMSWHGGQNTLTWVIKPKLMPIGPPFRNKIAAIKVIRSYYGVNLKDGKAMVDRAGELPALTYASALALKGEMDDLGVTVELPNVLERMAKALG